jgi:uncharacterized protein YjlB
VRPETHSFDDDGGIPNSRLPVLVYRGVDPVRRKTGPLVELWGGAAS